MMVRRDKGFTLVEMLVVIAIIAILAAALFPAIQNALNQARATAMKNKGRGIWVAVLSSNMEREPLNQGPLWPANIKDEVAGAGAFIGDPGESAKYFTCLMSDGTEANIGTVTLDRELRLVSDLTAEMLIAQGVVPFTDVGAIPAANIAWRVAEIGDRSAEELPFIVSKNFKPTIDEIHQAATADENILIDLDAAVKPFGSKHGVWITRGGGTFDARRRYLSEKTVAGIGSNTVPLWVAGT